MSNYPTRSRQARTQNGGGASENASRRVAAQGRSGQDASVRVAASLDGALRLPPKLLTLRQIEARRRQRELQCRRSLGPRVRAAAAAPSRRAPASRAAASGLTSGASPSSRAAAASASARARPAGGHARRGRRQDARRAPHTPGARTAVRTRHASNPAGAFAQRCERRLADRTQKTQRHMQINSRQSSSRGGAHLRRRGFDQARTPRAVRPQREEQPPQGRHRHSRAISSRNARRHRRAPDRLAIARELLLQHYRRARRAVPAQTRPGPRACPDYRHPARRYR